MEAFCPILDYIFGSPRQPAESVPFSKHLQNVCKGCFLQLREFNWIVVNALVSSQSLFCSLCKFQSAEVCIQYSVARIVSETSKFHRLTLVLKQMQWLSVEYCSIYKTASLVYRFLQTGFLKYLDAYLPPYISLYHTR